jgi:integrase
MTFRAANGLCQLAMLLARDAGLRHRSIVEIAAVNCDFNKRLLSGKTKGGATYSVPMTKRLYERLLFVCAQTNSKLEPLLATFRGRNKPPAYGSISDALRTAKAIAKVETPWGLHDLRRTGARALYERTHDLRKVQRFLSHSNMQQSCWYLGASGIDLSPGDLEPTSPYSNEPEANEPTPPAEKQIA